MLVPALLFTLQNNLGYFALTHLDVATYQVPQTAWHLAPLGMWLRYTQVE